MIKSFKDAATEELFQGKPGKGYPREILSRAIVKLDQLNAALILEDLRIPPSNRLEALRGNLNGYFSIRINHQWRLCFRWENGNAFDVEIKDYHR